jgi:hypothetical protein
MTWKVVTTCILDCAEPFDGPHTTYFRNLPAPSAGDIVTCPYCEAPAVVKATSVLKRVYKGEHRAVKQRIQRGKERGTTNG